MTEKIQLPPQTTRKAWSGAVTALHPRAHLGRRALGPGDGARDHGAGLGRADADRHRVAVWFFRNWERVTGAALFCQSLPVLVALALLVALFGCATVRAVATPERIEVVCQALDSTPVTLTVDVAAFATGQTLTVAMLRSVRRTACEAVGLAEALEPEVAPVPVPQPRA